MPLTTPAPPVRENGATRLSRSDSHFFTPVYSSTVFEEIVVVVFVLSPTCVYVAVVEIVLHALQLPKLTATQASTANINKNFFILLCFLVDVIDDLLFTELGH